MISIRVEVDQDAYVVRPNTPTKLLRAGERYDITSEEGAIYLMVRPAFQPVTIDRIEWVPE